VLLDENLVESEHWSAFAIKIYLAVIAANRNPYYIREHSKRILRGALCSDSKFLADINVMDYSLVCGVLQLIIL
jgi:1-phosphatidylinositol-3-phosphate 5-kinase